MRGLTILVAFAAGLVAVAPAAAAEKPHLSPSDRAAINRTLDVFVTHAVKRQNAAVAYDVVTANMRGGMTRRQWSGGNIPVYPYPAAGRRFHKWTILYRNSEEIGIELILDPPKRLERKMGQILFHVYLQPRRGRWLVDQFMPGATFAPVGKAPVVQGPGDFQGTPGGQTYNRETEKRDAKPARLSADFIFLPFAFVGLLLAGFATWGVVHWLRDRRLADAHVGGPLSIPVDGTRARPRHRP